MRLRAGVVLLKNHFRWANDLQSHFWHKKKDKKRFKQHALMFPQNQFFRYERLAKLGIKLLKYLEKVSPF